MTRKGQVPSRTPAPGALPKTESKDAAGPPISGAGPIGDAEDRHGGGATCREPRWRVTSHRALLRADDPRERAPSLSDGGSCARPGRPPSAGSEGLRLSSESLLCCYKDQPALALRDFVFLRTSFTRLAQSRGSKGPSLLLCSPKPSL